MLKFSFEEVKEICKKAAHGDEISQKVLEYYIDEDISCKAMNEFVEEEAGKEFGEHGADRNFSDEELETMCQKNAYAITDFGKDDRKRFAVIKDIHNAKKVENKRRRGTSGKKGFYLWLLRQTKRDDPVGDFACDAKQDKTFPKTTSAKGKITNYLYSKGACHEAIESFNEAYAEFKLEANAGGAL